MATLQYPVTLFLVSVRVQQCYCTLLGVTWLSFSSKFWFINELCVFVVFVKRIQLKNIKKKKLKEKILCLKICKVMVIRYL